MSDKNVYCLRAPLFLHAKKYRGAARNFKGRGDFVKKRAHLYIVAGKRNCDKSTRRFPPSLPLFFFLFFFFFFLFFSIHRDEHAACSLRYGFSCLASKKESGNRPTDLSQFCFPATISLYVCRQNLYMYVDIVAGKQNCDKST